MQCPDSRRFCLFPKLNILVFAKTSAASFFSTIPHISRCTTLAAIPVRKRLFKLGLAGSVRRYRRLVGILIDFFAWCLKEVPRPKDMSRDMAIRAHLSLHDPCEAPYHCRRCNYRTTVRLHLFDHFAQKHNNTG